MDRSGDESDAGTEFDSFFLAEMDGVLHIETMCGFDQGGC